MSYDFRVLARVTEMRVGARPREATASLCAELKVGRHTLRRALCQERGTDLRGLRRSAFLAQVRPKLCAVGTSVKEVAFEMGYADGRSFARAVKRVCGLSPTQLRERLASQTE